MPSMDPLLTAREAAKLAHRSRATIHRDATSGKLPVAQQFPGYNGPRLFRAGDIREVYDVAAELQR